MSCQLHIRPDALRDLDDIAAYIQKDNEEAAFRFLDNAAATFDMLAGASGIGTLYRVHGANFHELRCFPVRGFGNYLVFYDRMADRIDVVRVLHGARNIPPILRSGD
jgi:toxin ParE1/3/4